MNCKDLFYFCPIAENECRDNCPMKHPGTFEADT